MTPSARQKMTVADRQRFNQIDEEKQRVMKNPDSTMEEILKFSA